MPTLVSRSKFIPGGFRYVQPEIRWQSRPNASFDSIVQSLITARRANPAQLAKYRWATDYPTVANEVDAFNARICEQMGWTDYYTGGAGTGPFPPLQPSSLSRSAGQVVAGAKSLAEMFGPQGPVGRDQAERRAAVCAVCPVNEKGDWTRFFTVPASAAIRVMLGLIKDAKLETSRDAELMICTACGCPCKTKVWARLDHILPHMGKESRDALHSACWIRTEQQR